MADHNIKFSLSTLIQLFTAHNIFSLPPQSFLELMFNMVCNDSTHATRKLFKLLIKVIEIKNKKKSSNLHRLWTLSGDRRIIQWCRVKSSRSQYNVLVICVLIHFEWALTHSHAWRWIDSMITKPTRHVWSNVTVFTSRTQSKVDFGCQLTETGARHSILLADYIFIRWTIAIPHKIFHFFFVIFQIYFWMANQKLDQFWWHCIYIYYTMFFLCAKWTHFYNNVDSSSFLFSIHLNIVLSYMLCVAYLLL